MKGCVCDKPGTQVMNGEGRIFSEKEYYFTVRVRPGFMNQERSKYHITLNVKKPKNGTITKTLIVPASKISVYRDVHGNESRNIIKRFSYAELGLPEKYHEENNSYDLTAKLDFNGDGAEMVFDVQKDGKLEIKWNDVDA